MASNSGWSKEVPSGSSSIAQGDDDIRSFKSFMQAWWEQEHYATDGSATSAGIAKHGAGRAFVGNQSALSNPTADNDGRFFHARDTGKFFIGDVSSSSWSLVADNIQLSSENTWTATQEVSDLVVTNHFSGVTSYVTKLGADVGVAANSQTVSVLTTTQNFFNIGDYLIGSYDTVTNGGILDIYPRLAPSDHSQLGFYLFNHGGSRVTIPSGSTVRVLGFKKET